MKRTNIHKLFKNVMALLVVAFVFQLTPVFAEAETVADYDAEAAVAYAKEHYDDTDPEPDCIRFVKECLEAGGVPTDEARTYGYTVIDYMRYAVQNGYAARKKLTTEEMPWSTPQWYVPVEENEDNLTVGDGILYYCTECDKYFHASLYTSADEVEGQDGLYAYYHAQNRAVENAPLCKIDCFTCKDNRENVELYSLHITSAENGYDEHYNDAVISGLNAEKDSDGNILISWDALDGADGYKVFKKNGKNSVYSMIGETTSTEYIFEEQPEEGYNFYFYGTTICR